MSLTPSQPSASHSTASPAPDGGLSAEDAPPPAQNANVAFNISNEETIRRLRGKGQPIRLFGESDKDRRLRLRALELIEEKGHERVGGQNDFRKALEDVESAERLMRDRNANSTAGDEGKGKKKDDSASGDGEIAVLDLALIKTDKDKLYPVIYYALKRVLKEWGESLGERPGESHLSLYPFISSLTRASEHVKSTRQGKLAAATQVQSAQYLKPLFKLIRSRVRRCVQKFCLGCRAHTPVTLVPPGRYAGPSGRDRTPHAKTSVSASQRRVSPSLDWQCPLAYWGYHGWVGPLDTGLSFLNADPLFPRFL